jgi:DNA-binding transcriptional LysR family regulator
MSALEHDLGTVLFDRDRRGTSLTPPGQQFLEDAIPLLAASRRIRQIGYVNARGMAARMSSDPSG